MFEQQKYVEKRIALRTKLGLHSSDSIIDHILADDEKYRHPLFDDLRVRAMGRLEDLRKGEAEREAEREAAIVLLDGLEDGEDGENAENRPTMLKIVDSYLARRKNGMGQVAIGGEFSKTREGFISINQGFVGRFLGGEHHPSVFDLQQIYLRPSYRGRGLVSQLLEHVLENCRMPVFVECIYDKKWALHLLRNGWKPATVSDNAEYGVISLFKLPSALPESAPPKSASPARME